MRGFENYSLYSILIFYGLQKENLNLFIDLLKKINYTLIYEIKIKSFRQKNYKTRHCEIYFSNYKICTLITNVKKWNEIIQL